MKNIFFLLFIFCYTISAQQIAIDTLEIQNLEEVIVSSVRAKENLPIAFNNISKDELSKRNLGQDIPILLNLEQIEVVLLEQYQILQKQTLIFMRLIVLAFTLMK